MSSEDAIEHLGWLVDEIHNAPWVEFASGEVGEVLAQELLQKDPVLENARNSYVVFARGIAPEPDYRIERAELIKVSLPQANIQRISLGIRASFAQSDSGASSVVSVIPNGAGRIYRGVPPQESFPSSVSWVARRLYEAGCNVDPTSFRIRSLMAALSNPAG